METLRRRKSILILIKEVIEAHKNECLNNPEKFLLTKKCNKKQFFEIFYHIKSLKYSDKPDYEFIRLKLKELLNAEIMLVNFQSDPSLINYFRNNMFHQTNNQIGLNPLLELLNNQKESTRNSSGGHISPNNDFNVEIATKSNSHIINNINQKNKESELNNKEKSILKRKRLRISDYEDIKNIKSQNDQNKKIKEINHTEMKPNNNLNPQLLLNQLSEDKIVEYINNLKFLNCYYLNYYSFDLYVKCKNPFI